MALRNLGLRVPFAGLSQKRVIEAVRFALRQHYRNTGTRVRVANELMTADGEWFGHCQIDDEYVTYHVSPSTRT